MARRGDRLSYNFDDNETATLESALNVYGNADELRKLAAQIEQEPPTKKAALAALILRHLEGDGLRAAWEKLQQAAVAETVHSQSLRFPDKRFRAKYGRAPDLGVSSALRFFFTHMAQSCLPT